VLGDRDRAGAAARDLDGQDLAGEEPGRLAGRVFLLRSRGKYVAGFARDLIVPRQIVGRLRHRIGAELALDLRVREACADRRIEDPAVAAERGLGLVDDEGGAAHALDAAGDKDLALAAGDGLRRDHDRIEPAAAIALQYGAGDPDRQTGEQSGMATDAA